MGGGLESEHMTWIFFFAVCSAIGTGPGVLEFKHLRTIAERTSCRW